MSGYSRRDFVQAGAGVAAGLAFARPLRAMPWESAATIKVGLVGCGGRGTGAARDCLRGSEGVELVAVGDLFADRVSSCREHLAKAAAENPAFAAKYKVDDGHAFSGMDAYQKVLASGIDLVILATPPGFRPVHFAAAVDAGKHVFMEKPVAVDPTGVRAVIAAAARAKAKGLAVVAGTQRRHDPSYRAVIERVHGGAIGELVSGQVFWNQGGLWHAARQAGWSDLDWQVRNWLYFTWLSGDHVVEQHIHNIDVANWVVGSHPVRAVGVGGRQWRTGAEHGHIFDHFAVDFEYPGGVHVTSMCRQIDGTADHVGEQFRGTKGTTDAAEKIVGASAFSYAGVKVNPYVQEHTDLIASIRDGKPLNEGQQVAESTLSAIMAREAAYTGQVITWDQLLASTQDLTPPAGQGAYAVPPVPMPGRTKVDRRWSE
ncbi:MAG: Gfo/Idh/MocA family oxidoreductase [Gemmatimonadetes bacterium]|nr:Gfo/Idh/MocA family oxidoreductase [Gemmatimonadota bacterium]